VSRLGFYPRGLLLLVGVVLVLGVFVSPAFAGESWWHVTSSSRPSFLPPEGVGLHEKRGQVVVVVSNLGDVSVDGGVSPVSIVDRLPGGLRAVSIKRGKGAPVSCAPVSVPLSCSFTGVLAPFAQIEVVVGVEVEPGAVSGELNEVSVSGGGTPPVSIARAITVSSEPVPFGVEQNVLAVEEEGGGLDARAGSHPFQVTSTLVSNQIVAAGESYFNPGEVLPEPVALPKDINVKLPVGLVGNPSPIARCSLAQFFTLTENENSCSPQSAVGVASVLIDEPSLVGVTRYNLPLFNIEPSFGEPARLGFYVPETETPVFIDFSLRGGPGSGEEYAITASSLNTTQTAGFLSSEITIWGVPEDPRHDSVRGWNCLHEADGLEHGACQPLDAEDPESFQTLPTACTGVPLESPVELDSWEQPLTRLVFATTQAMATLTGCNRLPFAPAINAQPTTSSAASPSGLDFSLNFHDEGLTSAEGLAQSQLKDTVVTLPEGFTINPSAGVGLAGCTPADYARETLGSPAGGGCPENSELGEVTVETPLLTQKLAGVIYAAQPYENPFGSLVALYVVVKNPETGVMVKLAGKVIPNPVTGQLTTTFEDNPQLPFDHFNFHFREGQQAPLITPATCGTYTTQAQLSPWSAPLTSLADTSSFTITSGVGGGPCPGPVAPFAPGIAAGTLNNNAGAFSAFDVRLTRGDGDQEISGFSTNLPEGLTGVLTGIPYCPEADIALARTKTGAQEEAEPSCPAASQIGHTLVGTGVGAVLAYVPGKVYLAGPYNGDPFSLVSVTSAKVGPFDLGTVVLRFALHIDPRTAQVSVDPTASEPIPTILDGIVTHVRDIRVYIDRASFMLNPTSCAAKSITSTLTASEGATTTIGSPFQAANCTILKFAPKVAVATAGHASKLDGASLTFKISYPKSPLGKESWFEETKFDIPKQLPARLETLQRACLAKVFETNPAACPPAATIGHATIHTPVLPVPLTGPVYFVSYGGAKFPEAVFALQGDGVSFDLHGETFISKTTGVTSATFRNMPDVPFETAEVTIPTGRYSEFGANLLPATNAYDFCGHKLTMPTLLKAQNGLQINQNTPITITGCTKKHAKPKHKTKH